MATLQNERMNSARNMLLRAFDATIGNTNVEQISLNRMIIYISCFFALVVALTATASATDYYVRTDGNDSHDGLSLATAWKTIQHAADTLTTGDVVRVQSGTYNEEVVITTSGTPSGRISFIGDNLPFIDSTGVAFDIQANYITVTGFKIRADTRAFCLGDTSYPPPANANDHITISHNTIECLNGDGILCGYVNDAIIEWNDINVDTDGISWKTGYTFGQDVKNNIISHNKISVKQGYECLYIGRYTENITVTYNYMDRAGWNALNVGESKNSYIGYNELNGTNLHHQCIDARNKDSFFEGNHIYNNPGLSDSHMFYLVGGNTEESRVRNILVKDLLIENSCPYSNAFHIEDYQDVTLEKVTIEDTPGATGALIVNSVQMAVSENFSLIDSDIQMKMDIYDSNKAKIINTKISTLYSVNSDVTIYYYLDVLVQDQNGNPVSGAMVTVPSLEIGVTPINLHKKEIVTPVKTAKILIPQQITTTYTGADGHTPLPLNSENTLVIADFKIDSHGSTTTTQFNSYTITAEKDDVTVTMTDIDADTNWYRPDPNTYPGTINGTIIITLPITGDTGTLTGMVTDGTDPISEATVTAAGTSPYSNKTNATGGYTITLPAGTYTVTASATGYENASQEDITVSADSTTIVNFQLTPAPDNLHPTTTYSITPSPNTHGWNNITPVIVTLFRADSDGSMVDHTNYSTISEIGPWTTVAGDEPFDVTVTDEGNTTIWYYSVDTSTTPNVEPTMNMTVWIDTSPPAISDVTNSPTTITWTTDEPATTQVEYGLDAGYGSSTTIDTNLVTTHHVTLTGLSSNTTYHYRVKSKDVADNPAASRDHTITTPLTTDAIVGLWHFDEEYGTTAPDSSGHNNDGTIHGASWTEDILNSSALRFDGADDYVSIPDSPSLNPANEITIGAWVKTGAIPRAGWNKIIAKPYTNYTSPYQQYALTLYDGQFVFEMNIEGIKYGLICTETIEPNTWYQVAGTYDGSEMRIYVNGELDGTLSKSGAIASYPTDVYIGAGIYSNAQTEYLNGTIDEVKILNIALSAEDIRSEYVVGRGDTTPPTITAHSPTGPDVPVGTVITATFSEPMSTSSAEGAFSVSPSVAGTFSWIGNTMTFTQGMDLSYGTTYMATIDTAATDLAGNHIKSAYSWQFTTETALDTPPPAISDVGASDATSSTVVITWTTDELATAQVEYGLDTGYGSSTTIDTNLVTTHHVTLTGLSSNTTYHYRVKSKDVADNPAASRDHTITTPLTTDAIVGLWHFDEEYGTTAPDSSGHNNDGTIHGASWTEDILNSSALRFDGADDYVSIPDSPSLNPANEITIGAWVKTGAIPRAGWNKIIAKPYTNYTSPYQQYALTLYDGQFVFEMNIEGIKYGLICTETIEPNTWYQVAGTYDGSEMRIYVNGELDGTLSKSGAIASYPTDVYIGAGIYSNAQTEYLNGTIDEVKILNIALSAEDIRSDYEAGHNHPSSFTPIHTAFS